MVNAPDGRIIFEHEREDLAKIVNITMSRNDTNIAGGNFSFKVKDNDGKDYIIMTPTMMSQAYLGELSPEQILVVEPHTREVIAGEGKLTREINLHEGVYDANPDIRAVFHSHAKNNMFWATSGLNEPNVTEATQKLKRIETLDYEPNCSEPLAELVSDKIRELGDAGLMHLYLLDSHGILATVGKKGEVMDGLSAVHQALAIVDTAEWNAEIAYKQAVFQKLGLLDGFYSESSKIGTLDDLIAGKSIYNRDAGRGVTKYSQGKAAIVNGD
ncbi:class II aldolase/adducin family protein [Lactobacillus sp. UCMA15818]|uniref:class II aldolase/adducin family protein n=1 Tax=Lactobacillaceae TaxID=33958 RepID=UPI0025B146E5|nr:class II aldolase/adducin family protein [Lactobacillus sp. UCMA15818]MDN2454191.1 aldolase [Lactobacillus sp. UCMA15818]